MQLSINVPLRADIVNGGFEIAVAHEGMSWNKSQLGDSAGRRGVYIHHADGRILYVGKTTVGEWGTFGERLRREFQQSAASNSALFQLLAEQRASIRSYLLDLDDLEMMVDPGSMQLSRERKALIMEQVLIGIFEPPGNRG